MPPITMNHLKDTFSLERLLIKLTFRVAEMQLNPIIMKILQKSDNSSIEIEGNASTLLEFQTS